MRLGRVERKDRHLRRRALLVRVGMRLVRSGRALALPSSEPGSVRPSFMGLLLSPAMAGVAGGVLLGRRQSPTLAFPPA